jgi:DNA-3-methyladenine glycosylase II
MDEIGHVRREIIPDIFMALVNSIIGQQISAKAHKTVWARFQTAFDPVTPEHIDSIPAEALQTCGISMRKASYIKGIASGILDKSLDLTGLQTMSDDDVCKTLSRIKGIGVWTAEMLMIFSMQRMDVMSRGDMAIIRGLRILHRHRQITPKLFAKYKRRYSPYATVASLYLWQISLGADLLPPRVSSA